MAWFSVRCPVREKERTWIEESLRWMVGQFGEGPLHGEVVLPTAAFFPGGYSGTEGDVRRVLDAVRRHMGVDPARIDLELVDDDDHELLSNVPLARSGRNETAGHYQRREGRSVVTISGAHARDPIALVATIAHELGHERLLGEGRIPPDRADHEPLTDLLTVFFGLGIFNANAAFQFSKNRQRWRSNRLGYLTEPMYGYALAYYTWLRRDRKPDWQRYLDTNPRVYLKRGLRYLRGHRRE